MESGRSSQLERSLAEARPSVYWLDALGGGDTERADGADELPGSADLVVVGAGYTGLWAAFEAVSRDPGRNVVVIDRAEVAAAASGRNGGFVSASLTHGLLNGLARFSDMERVLAVERDNFDGLVRDVAAAGIDARLERNGVLEVAVAPWQVPDIAELAQALVAHGRSVDLLDGEQLRLEVASPTYEGGAWVRDGEGLVDPARLGRGLAQACRDRGVRIVTGTALTALERHGAGLLVRTDRGALRAPAAILATGAFPTPLRRITRRVVPVYDHVLATEPLSAAQLGSLGWRNRQGISDGANQFHYYRLTADDRVVWGGYDAVFHNWGRIDAALEQRDETHRRLAAHFFETFPQLEGLRFTHRWGGVIDTSTRFSVGFGTAFDGRVAYAVGYTGLGVGATRFGAHVCLDLLDRPDSELLGLELVRRPLLPFPPEPIRTAGIQLTRRAIARADANEGRRGPWLRTLDRLGLGFDS